MTPGCTLQDDPQAWRSLNQPVQNAVGKTREVRTLAQPITSANQEITKREHTANVGAGIRAGAGVSVSVRCYAELNDFLPRERRQVAFAVRVARGTTVKDLLESIGVPHTEVDLVLVDLQSEDFGRRLADGERLAAYPVFEALDIAAVSRVRPEPLREPRFVLDGHLGRLAAYLRLAGFDTWYRSDAGDAELAGVAAREHRILLTRDRGLLMRRAVTHGHAVRATRPENQLAEIVGRFDLSRLARPFTRCTCCNAPLRPATADEVARLVPPRSRRAFDAFLCCPACGRVYWQGSHHVRLAALLRSALAEAEPPPGP